MNYRHLYIFLIFLLFGCHRTIDLGKDRNLDSDCFKILKQIGTSYNKIGVIEIGSYFSIDTTKYSNWSPQKMEQEKIPNTIKGLRYYQWVELARSMNQTKSCNQITSEDIEEYLGKYFYTVTDEDFIVIDSNEHKEYKLFYGIECPNCKVNNIRPSKVWNNCFSLHFHFNSNGYFRELTTDPIENISSMSESNEKRF